MIRMMAAHSHFFSLYATYAVFLILVLVACGTSSSSSDSYQRYIFYYATTQYPLHSAAGSANLTNDTTQTDPTSTSLLESISIEVNIDEDISISIAKSNLRPYIVSINNRHNGSQHFELNYDDYDEFNTIDILHTPDRVRRRLRICVHRWLARCGWWSRCWRTRHYTCPPIAPPLHDRYWLTRWKRAGRFVAMYPGVHFMRWYNYWGCARYCSEHYGGLASIHSHLELWQAHDACYQVMVHPKPSDHDNHAGNWRGYACWIGLTRPFKKWDDGKAVKFSYWNPGEPNNWGLQHHRVGHNEDCTEMYVWQGGRWNDATCHAKRSCVCQEPRGLVNGRFVGVQAMRTYKEARNYCHAHYGTELATINSDEENKHARDLCASLTMAHTLSHCWIGLQRPFHEWDDGSNAEEKFDNWMPGEPNDWGKKEDCTELYAEHNGRWNDLVCHGKRYFLCNAQTKIQRMDFTEREEMIAMRMNRHRIRWQAYQMQAYRKKIRKAFFERLKAQKALIRKHAMDAQKKQREYYRQAAFSKMMGRVGAQSNQMALRNRRFGAKMAPHNNDKKQYAFSSSSAFFDDMDLKRRRMRAWVEQNSDSVQRSNRERAHRMEQERKRRQEQAEDKQALRQSDDEVLFYDLMSDSLDDGEEPLAESDENTHPTPKRCVLARYTGGHLYEVCINDDYLFVTRYVEKMLRDLNDDEEEEDVGSMRMHGGTTVEYDVVVDVDHEALLSGWLANETRGSDYAPPMGLGAYETFRYAQAMKHDDDMQNETTQVVQNWLSLEKVEQTQTVSSSEFIYDHDSHHKKQCYHDNGNNNNGDDEAGKICLEFADDTQEMSVHVEEYEWYIAFDDDQSWNEINHVKTMFDGHERSSGNDQLQKCITYFEKKICVVKRLTPYKKANDDLDSQQLNEYRVTITKPMDENQMREISGGYGDDYEENEYDGGRRSRNTVNYDFYDHS